MFIVIGFMFAGILLGYLLRKMPMLQKISTPISWTIYLLLFLMGISVGTNEEVLRNLASLGGTALLLSLSGTLGSVLMAWLVWKKVFLQPSREEEGKQTKQSEEPQEKVRLAGSLIVVAFFLSGALLGRFHLIPSALVQNELSSYVLYLLMFQVGLSIGSDRKLKEILFNLRPKVLLVPLATMTGTLAFSALAALFITRWSLADCLAVGSGFGYYSLSSILITQLKGATIGVQLAAELGTIALLSNIIREILALLGAPLFAKWFGPLAPICAGGATTMDTTLPIITRCSGKDKVFISIIHGILMDFSVPFLVSFFCSL